MAASRQVLKGRLERLKYDLDKIHKETEDLLRQYPWRSATDGTIQTKYETMLRSVRAGMDKKLGSADREHPFAMPGTPRRGPVDSTSAETAYNIYKDLQSKCETQEREGKDAKHTIARLTRENADLQRQLDKTIDDVKMSTQTPRIHPDVVTELRKQVNVLRGEKAELRKQLKQMYAEKNEHMNRVVAKNRLIEGNPALTDSSDPNRPTTIAERLTNVYSHEWMEAFESLIKIHETERECTDTLLAWLTSCYEICRKKAEDQREWCKRCLSLDSKPLSTAVPTSVAVAIRDFQKKTAVNTLPHVKEICWSRLGVRTEEPEIPAYVHKCAELCWYMAIQNPPLEMEWLVERGTPFDTELFSSYTLSGDKVDYVTWPVLYMGAGLTVMAKGVAQGYDKEK
ncbi:uncharacterized protein LOC110440377 [Mizuhopecten yessoensis]|uniref:Mitochondria-eating protein C-terminal domain-containing protein n=1 Tax=Mizuhopecten yessoensis TaxID=6573 RepID=A0A210PLB5_MIZYE|nr:uncharacterized protein LOC110440377 [Mizuhopecten yessoensis]XP_021339100.1 uncharacterized protein LOC110440377 [Mizuhopecten yessoensis]OWF37279.1 hypothetical protein KP79_PYT12697 [Mizuhopecten yessoensis]